MASKVKDVCKNPDLESGDISDCYEFGSLPWFGIFVACRASGGRGRVLAFSLYCFVFFFRYIFLNKETEYFTGRREGEEAPVGEVRRGGAPIVCLGR